MKRFILLLVVLSASRSEIVRQRRQTQFCSGSNCNQNNFGGFFPVGGFVGFPIGGFRAAQTCFGSNCNQNNGRKKREIVPEELELECMKFLLWSRKIQDHQNVFNSRLGKGVYKIPTLEQENPISKCFQF